MGYVFTKARKKALGKARKKWMSMSPRARRKAMPPTGRHLKAHVKKHGVKYLERKRYPVGTTITLDVGRPGYHYVHAKKTEHGWEVGPLRMRKKK
jgi:hypothetical protein